jgi:glycerol-3-phosphate cytidylyltransferase
MNNNMEKIDTIYDIAITVGCFDMLHAGHLNLFREMRSRAKNSIAFIHNNKSIFENKGKFPIQNLEDREANIMDSDLIDGTALVGNADPSYELEKMIKAYRLKKKSIVYVRGDDWKDFPGKKVIEKYGIPIVYIKYTEGISSTKLREQLNNDRMSYAASPDLGKKSFLQRLFNF